MQFLYKWKVGFFLLRSRFFLLLLTFSIFSMMYLFVVLFVFILFGVCRASWMCKLLLFNKFRTFSAISLNIFSSLFLMFFSFGSSVTYMFGHLFYISLRFCPFLFILFSLTFFSLRNLNCSIFTFAFLFFPASSNLLLNPSSEFFISVIILFNPKISLWCFL